MNALAAKEYLKRALKIQQRTSSDVTTDRQVAVTLHDIGRCLIEINEYIDTKDYLERVLKIQQRTSIDVADDRKVAYTIHDIGRCFIK